MFLTRHRLNVTCTASAATYQTAPIIGGLLYAVRFTKASASAFATGATCVISAVAFASAPDIDVSHDILTFLGTSVSQIVYPRREMQSTAGATAGALGGAMVPLVGDRIQVVVASGGANGRGTFDFFVEGR